MNIQLYSKKENAIAMGLIGREELVEQLIDIHMKTDGPTDASPTDRESVEKYKQELIIIRELIQEIY